jgi:hypothetical protein
MCPRSRARGRIASKPVRASPSAGPARASAGARRGRTAERHRARGARTPGEASNGRRRRGRSGPPGPGAARWSRRATGGGRGGASGRCPPSTAPAPVGAGWSASPPHLIAAARGPRASRERGRHRAGEGAESDLSPRPTSIRRRGPSARGVPILVGRPGGALHSRCRADRAPGDGDHRQGRHGPQAHGERGHGDRRSCAMTHGAAESARRLLHRAHAAWAPPVVLTVPRRLPPPGGCSLGTHGGHELARAPATLGVDDLGHEDHRRGAVGAGSVSVGQGGQGPLAPRVLTEAPDDGLVDFRDRDWLTPSRPPPAARRGPRAANRGRDPTRRGPSARPPRGSSAGRGRGTPSPPWGGATRSSTAPRAWSSA